MTKEIKEFLTDYTKHIKQPYTLPEIIDKIKSNDFNAELIMQHLLRLISNRS